MRDRLGRKAKVWAKTTRDCRPGPWLSFVHRGNVCRTMRRIVIANMVGRYGRIEAATIPWVCKPVTLIEVCCSATSAFSRSVMRSGGAAIRVTWPPPVDVAEHAQWAHPYMNRRRPSKRIQQRILARFCRFRLPSTKEEHHRKRTWYLNVDWPVHQAALCRRIRLIAPVTPTEIAVLHTSPECRMFSPVQSLNRYLGRFDMAGHRHALTRLAFMKRLHISWREPLAHRRMTRLGLHEQPPGCRVDRCQKVRSSNPWPWAIGPKCRRTTINACMVGVKGANGNPVFKGWTFESDSPLFHQALQGLSCSGDHEHAPTSLANGFNAPRVPNNQVASIKALEKYPHAVGVLLAAACGLTPVPP